MANELDQLNLAQAGTLPPELYQQQQALNRQQQMATMLMQQGQQQPQGQMVSGRYVPTSFFQNLQPVANMLTGAYLAKQGDVKAAELAKQLREGKSAAEESIINKMVGTPAQATELAGPYAGKVPMPIAVQPGIAPDLAGALRDIRTNPYGAGKEYTPTILKQMMPDPTELERNFKAAKAQGYSGTINDYKNQMTEDQKENNRIARARLNLSAQEMAFNTGMPMGGISNNAALQNVPQAPLRTINPGSPILAPGQQTMPQAGQPQVAPQQSNLPQLPPRFNSKAEQDAWLAGEKKRSELRVEAQDKLPGALNTVNSGLKAITGMIGDTTVDAQGNLVYGKIPPHKGFNDAVGFPSAASGFGASSFIKGSDWKNFEARFKEIEGKSFLSAIDSLRGTGAISEVEGAKATSAINRMSLSQSPAEFVEAANELKSVMTKGYSASQQRAGVAPTNYGAQPTLPGVKMRYNLQTGQWE